jgi:hypothetical protein
MMIEWVVEVIRMRLLPLAACIALVCMVGCEQEPPMPPWDEPQLHEPEPEPEPEPERPTAEQLLRGPRQRIQLEPLPLAVHAPEGWEVRALRGQVVFLQGPTPAGEVQIHLNSRPTMRSDQFELLIAGARAELEENADILRLELEQIGNMQVLHRQVVEPLPENGFVPEPQPDDLEVDLGTPLRWTIAVFIPRNDHFEVYELNFIGLSVEQYEQDRELLDSIIGSLEYRPT